MDLETEKQNYSWVWASGILLDTRQMCRMNIAYNQNSMKHWAQHVPEIRWRNFIVQGGSNMTGTNCV